jgi:hypothetical protein
MILSRPGLLRYQLFVELIFLNAMSYLPQIPYSDLTKIKSQQLRTLYEYGVLRRIFGRNRHGVTGGCRELNNEQHRNVCAL